LSNIVLGPTHARDVGLITRDDRRLQTKAESDPDLFYLGSENVHE